MHKEVQVDQSLTAPRLDTTADTLALRAEALYRSLAPGFSMTKWPGYAEDEGRTRFQRRIPPDVAHAFNNEKWIRIPLKLPAGDEAKRRALAWYVIYEEEFARIRGGEHVQQTPGGASKKPLSEFTQDEVRALIEPIADDINRRQYEHIASGAAAYDELLGDHTQLEGAVRDVLSGKGSQYLSGLSGLFLLFRGIPYSATDDSFRRFVFEHARALMARAVKPNSARLTGDDVEPPPEPDWALNLRIPSSKAKGLTLSRVS